MSGWYRPQLVDKDGVPELIQDMRYRHFSAMVEVRFFNDGWRSFPVELVCPSVGLMQYTLTRMQWLECENNVAQMALAHWKEWFSQEYKEAA